MVQQRSPGSAGAAGGRGMRVSGGAVASLVGLGLLVVFMVQNTERITLSFLFWSFTWPLWLLTLISALVGALVWFGLGVMRRHRRRTARREDRRD
jgi:uncharacterized integral membrane protein